jgi:hypothetical protein
MTIQHSALPAFPWLLLAAAVDCAADVGPAGLDSRSEKSERREREAARAYKLARRVRLAALKGETLIPCADGETSQAPCIEWAPSRFAGQQTGINLYTLGQQANTRHTTPEYGVYVTPWFLHA